jgi:SAM-dependent methyltransferase
VPTLAPATIGVEVLDSPGADPALVRRMLTDIARANRWLGGVSALEMGLRFLLGNTPHPDPITLLDVGTGAGDLPLAARRWGARHGFDIRPVGVERHPAAAQLAHEQGVVCVVACGSALPFREDATGDRRQATAAEIHVVRRPLPVTRREAGIDLVLISQLLHHFDDHAAVTLIREAAGVARHGVILTDLRPMPGAALGFRLAGWMLGFHDSTVHDGIVSISRGRSAQALGQLAERAGAGNVMTRTLPTARVVVAFRTAG